MTNSITGCASTQTKTDECSCQLSNRETFIQSYGFHLGK